MAVEKIDMFSAQDIITARELLDNAEKVMSLGSVVDSRTGGKGIVLARVRKGEDVPDFVIVYSFKKYTRSFHVKDSFTLIKATSIQTIADHINEFLEPEEPYSFETVEDIVNTML